MFISYNIRFYQMLNLLLILWNSLELIKKLETLFMNIKKKNLDNITMLDNRNKWLLLSVVSFFQLIIQIYTKYFMLSLLIY